MPIESVGLILRGYERDIECHLLITCKVVVAQRVEKTTSACDLVFKPQVSVFQYKQEISHETGSDLIAHSPLELCNRTPAHVYVSSR